MKLDLFLAALLVFGVFGGIHFWPFSTQDEIPEAELEIHVAVRNDGGDDLEDLPIDDEDLRDIQVRMFIPELGIMIPSSTFDLDDHETAGKILGYPVSGEELCDQYVRITISNDDFQRTKYRPIIC